MPKKYVCKFSKEEIERAYLKEHRTIKEMCEFLGVKNTITASKVIRSFGIDTNANKRRAEAARNGMTDDEFRNFLQSEYNKGRSMNAIASDIGISPAGVRKYFIKYGIERVDKTSYFNGNPKKNPNWRGGKRFHEGGYVEVYCPNHPNANVRKCVYEHQLVMENHIGRYLEKGEVVHHIDGNKQNNNISNLLLLTNSDHAKLHAILRRSHKLMYKEGD